MDKEKALRQAKRAYKNGCRWVAIGDSLYFGSVEYEESEAKASYWFAHSTRIREEHSLTF